MNHGFYLRLAGTNLKNNARTYFPYWIAASLTVMMFFIIFSLSQDSGLAKMPGGTTLRSMLLLGVWVVALFAVIFLFYTNSFLIKRRKKEFGIYNILGMEKKHIARVIVLETLCTALISLSAGLAFGLLLYKLCLLLVVNLMHGQVPFGFELSVPAVLCTAALFGGIFLLTLLSNLRQIHLAKPIELLYGGEQGEKEPKTKWILAVAGAITLSAGYVISLLTANPLEAVTLFFLAVVLVIIGTYCLFTAGSIAVLKLLRKNKNYYYRPNHFISVSGMIYRMKQNAVGLANICILSTMVLVMISTTFSMYIGVDDLLLSRYPLQIAVSQRSSGSETLAAMDAGIDSVLEQQGQKTEKRLSYTYLAIGGSDSNGSITVKRSEDSYYTLDSLRMIYFLTLQDYNRMTGSDTILEDGEILLYNSLGTSMKSISLLGRTYTVKEQIEQFPVTGVSTANVASSYYAVVKDEAELLALDKAQAAELGKAASHLESYCALDIGGDADAQLALGDALGKRLSEDTVISVEVREERRSDFYALYGGFFFLGVFLGALFLMATVLIMYYKQVSEGYDDKERFHILQKVGMSRDEVRKSIHSQVLSVFFLPLIVAALHTAFAFPMTTCMMTLFNLTNTALFAWCTVGCFAVFGIFYAIVYWATARAYYRIVEK